MKNNEANIFVFIASIIIGIMISLNISFSDKGNFAFLDTKQYEDAANVKLKLLDDISNLNDQYNLSYSKYNKYESLGKNNAKLSEEMEVELDENKMNIGATEVQGDGIKVTLNDAPDFVKATKELSEQQYLIHNFDVALILNEIKIAGAEAISINGIRISDTSGVICDGLVLQVNGQQAYAPFYIEAIGNKDALMEYMNRDSSYLKQINITRQVVAYAEQENNITMSAYGGGISKKYLKSAEKIKK